MTKRGPARGGTRGAEVDDTDEQDRRPGMGAVERPDSADAFMDDPEDGPAVIDDDLAETLAEEFLQSATSGGDSTDEAMDRMVPEEIGGPFIETSAGDEFADDVDEANPEDAKAEPLPRAVSGLAMRPPGDR